MAINLLPWRQLRQQRQRWLTLGAITVLLTLLFSGVYAIHFFLQSNILQLKRQHRELTQSINDIHFNDEAKSYSALYNQLQSALQHQQQYKQSLALLSDILMTMPASSHILSLSWRLLSLTLEGNTTNRLLFQQWLYGLKDNRFIDQQSNQLQKKRGGYAWSLSMHMAPLKELSID